MCQNGPFPTNSLFWCTGIFQWKNILAKNYQPALLRESFLMHIFSCLNLLILNSFVCTRYLTFWCNSLTQTVSPLNLCQYLWFSDFTRLRQIMWGTVFICRKDKDLLEEKLRNNNLEREQEQIDRIVRESGGKLTRRLANSQVNSLVDFETNLFTLWEMPI